jgi:hypothetical protein
MLVMTGLGEMNELMKLVPTGVGHACAARIGDVFVRRNVVSLTFKEGIQEPEIGDLIELLAGPEIPAKELHAQFIAKALAHVSILFVTDMLGRARRLPWQVQLTMSRIARDLRALPPMLRGADAERMRELRTALIGDVMRVLRAPEHVKTLFVNWDLIRDQVEGLPELEGFDIPTALVGSLAHPMCFRVAALILREMEKGATATGAPPAGTVAPPPDAGSVKYMLHVIGERFIRERTIETDEVLRELHTRAVLSFPELPPDLQIWALAEQQAEQLAQDPEPFLRSLDAIYDLPRYAREVSTLGRSMRVLARRGEVQALFTIVVRLEQRHARGAQPREGTREGLAAKALAALADAEVLAPVAVALIEKGGAARDAAHGILVCAGAAGAEALCGARDRSGGPEVPRAKVIEVLREVGPAAVVPVLTALERALAASSHGSDDPTVVEDLLRGLPEIKEDRVGAAIAKFMSHRAPQVRRAAAAALASPWGVMARPTLVAALDDADEGVRVIALTGLRKVGEVDASVVRRVERFLTGATSAGDNVRAVAAALLTDVVPEARSDAIAVLCRAIEPRTRSFASMLRGEVTPQEDTLVVETIGRVLVQIGGEKGRVFLQRRIARSSGELKEKLSALLK